MTSRFFHAPNCRVRLALLVATGLTAAACAAAPRERPIRTSPIESGPMTLQAARAYLEGRWSLMSYEVFPPGQPSITLRGSGTLTYDSYGNMDMQIRVDDPAVAEALTRAGIPLANSSVSSTGRVAIDMQSRTMTYILEGQPPLQPTSGAGPLALSRPRYWEVEGNTLTLTTKADSGEALSVGHWQKQ